MLRIRAIRNTGARQAQTSAGVLHFDQSRGATARVPEAIAEELVASGEAYIPSPEELCPGAWLVRRRAGMGDVLCMSAALREVVARGGRVQVSTSRNYAALFDGLPLGGVNPNAASPVIFDGWLEHQPGRKEQSAAACMGDYWNLTLTDARPWFVLSDAERTWGQEQVAEWRVSGVPVVALFSRAGWATRTYREWRPVAKGLADAGCSVLGFDDLVLPCCKRPPSGLTVRQLAALLSAVDLVVSGDSGPMHLSQAVGVPAVAVFCCTNPAGSVGAGYDVTALAPEGMECWPCWSAACRMGEEDVPGGCVRAVSPAQIIEAALARLARPAQLTSEV